MSGGRNVLVAMYPGGGNIAQLRPLMACLVDQGHQVRVLVGPGVNRARLPADASLLRLLRSTGAEVMRLREPKATLGARFGRTRASSLAGLPTRSAMPLRICPRECLEKPRFRQPLMR